MMNGMKRKRLEQDWEDLRRAVQCLESVLHGKRPPERPELVAALAEALKQTREAWHLVMVELLPDWQEEVSRSRKSE